MANIAYLLTSADDDEGAAQKSMIEDYAGRKNLRIDNYITVDVPSVRKERSRRIKELFSNVDRWDVVIISDLAAVAHDIADIITIVGGLSEKGVRFVAAKQGMDLNGSGEGSPKAATALFDMLACLEKDLVSRRIKGALAQKKKDGVVLGRPKGSISSSKLDGKKDLIVEYLSKGVSKASLARILDTSPTNLLSYLRTRNIIVPKKASEAAATKKDADGKDAPEREAPKEIVAPDTMRAQTGPPVQFDETAEVLLCRNCGKNMHDPRTTTCSGGYVDYPNGESHPRVPYSTDEKERCPKCGVMPGGFHHEGCYMERCPKCGERLVSCGCRTRGIADEVSTGAQSRSVRILS